MLSKVDSKSGWNMADRTSLQRFVGQAGVQMALFSVGLCCITTLCTVLSLSALSTNAGTKMYTLYPCE